jgi:hypothetical protein
MDRQEWRWKPEDVTDFINQHTHTYIDIHIHIYARINLQFASGHSQQLKPHPDEGE